MSRAVTMHYTHGDTSPEVGKLGTGCGFLMVASKTTTDKSLVTCTRCKQSRLYQSAKPVKHLTSVPTPEVAKTASIFDPSTPKGDLFARAVSLGYTSESAARLADCFTNWNMVSDSCEIHPNHSISNRGGYSVDECEACEVIRLSTKDGYVMAVDVPTVAPVEPVAQPHGRSPISDGEFLIMRNGERRDLYKVILAPVYGEEITLVQVTTGRERVVTIDQMRVWMRTEVYGGKVAEKTGVGVDASGWPLDITLIRSMAHETRWAYSSEVFTITGPGVHNRHSAHRITAHVGECCEETRVHLHLSSEVTVIASSPVERPTHRYTIAMGDVFTVNGRPYRVCARRHADPVLVPVSYGAA